MVSEAYRQFKARKLPVDETPEAYVVDLRRLLMLARHRDADEGGAVVVEQLISGLMLEFQRGLRLSSAWKELTVTDCLDKIRALYTI